MSIIKPSITEELFRNFLKLEEDRPMYYLAVYRYARSIFLNMGEVEKLEELDRLIRMNIEIPLKSDFVSIVQAFYDPRIAFKKYAYVRIEDKTGYNAIEVTRYDIQRALELIKNWVYDEVMELAQYVRFSRTSDVYV